MRSRLQIVCLSMAATTALLGAPCSTAYGEFLFGEPEKVGWPISIDARPEYSPSIGAGGLSFFYSLTPHGTGDIWHASRESTSDNWGEAAALSSPINTAWNETDPHISDDALSLFFSSNRPGTTGDLDLWSTTRASLNDPWSTPTNLGELNTSTVDRAPRLSADGLTLHFARSVRNVPGSGNIYVSKRATTDSPWGEPEQLGAAVNSAGDEGPAVMSPDGLALFFSSNRDDSQWDMYVSTRYTVDAPWEPAVRLESPLNTAGTEFVSDVDEAGSTVYFIRSIYSTAWNNYDIWAAPIAKILASDFNDDGAVDGVDLITWETAFGASSAGDGDRDGDTDGGDFLNWQREYTGGSSGAAAHVGVPEPETLGLLVAGVAAMFLSFTCERARTPDRGSEHV